MMNKKIVIYRVFFKNRQDGPVSLTAEGGEALIKCLSSENCPRFVKIKDQVVSTYVIDQVVPIKR